MKKKPFFALCILAMLLKTITSRPNFPNLFFHAKLQHFVLIVFYTEKIIIFA